MLPPCCPRLAVIVGLVVGVGDCGRGHLELRCDDLMVDCGRVEVYCHWFPMEGIDPEPEVNYT